MNLQTELLKADGYTTEQIRQIEAYCNYAKASGRFSNRPAWVMSKDEPVLVCETTAEIIDKIRPGCRVHVEQQPRPKKQQKPRSRKQRKRAKRAIGSMIKVHITFSNVEPGGPTGEFIWARRISKNSAKIDNIPFMTSRVALGDLVRIDDEHEVIAVLEHVARTRLLVYADDEKQTTDEIVERYAKVRETLKKYDIETEGMFAGACSISVPMDVDDQQLEEIAATLEAEVIYHDDEDD